MTTTEGALPPQQREVHSLTDVLGDFTTEWRVMFIAAIALPLGILSAFLALGLLRLIAGFTNLFFFQRLSIDDAAPVDAHVGLAILVIPVIGGLIVGLMARYGSERIRGHGIPEAIEAILINGARVQPRVAFLKPLSAAISIGSGGPFGAEGPIILTGGSFGSLMAQFCHLSSVERKTLLVSGAAAGMSATFASPVAACLLAVELLLFEWKPRSLLPVAVASLAAYTARYYLLGSGPLFPMEPHEAIVQPDIMLLCCLVGITGGALSALMTSMVYASEDAFGHLPIHWMWWPALGGLAIGIGGYFFPRALGVGYGTIGELLQGDLALKTVIGVLIVKASIWSFSLGSGTSGGVLAPLLMMGGALGALESHVLPDQGVGFWPLVAMAAVLGGTMRTPFTAVIFSLELTHDFNMLAPLMAGCIFAYGFTVLFLKRSILTEKVSRRGLHLSREYAVDPLELHFVRDVIASPTVTSEPPLQTATPSDGTRGLSAEDYEMVPAISAVATLRTAARVMARSGATRLVVVHPDRPQEVAGVIELQDLLKAYRKNLDVEETRTRHLELPGWRRK